MCLRLYKDGKTILVKYNKIMFSSKYIVTFYVIGKIVRPLETALPWIEYMIYRAEIFKGSKKYTCICAAGELETKIRNFYQDYN